MKTRKRSQRTKKEARCKECGNLLFTSRCLTCAGSGQTGFLFFTSTCEICGGSGTKQQCLEWRKHLRDKAAQHGTGAQNDESRKVEEIEELEVDPLYFIVAIMAKFAKSDGVVTKKEIAAVETILREQALTPDIRTQAIQVFRTHKAGALTYSESLSAFADFTESAFDLRDTLCILLMRLAYADGAASPSALAAVQEACCVCEVEFARIEEIFRTDQTNLQAATAAAYDTLGCGPSATLDGLKKQYRYLTKIFHPDTLSGKNLAPELIKLAEEKFCAIQAAYEHILAERHPGGA